MPALGPGEMCHDPSTDPYNAVLFTNVGIVVHMRAVVEIQRR